MSGNAVVFAFTDESRYSNYEMTLVGSHTKDNTGFIGTSYLNYEINININKGWNLLSGIAILDIKPNSEIQKEDIYNFIYGKRDNTYVQIKDQESFKNFMQSSDVSQRLYPYVLGQSTWVYSKKSGKLSYNAIMFPTNPILTTGWNFVSITPYLSFSTNKENFLGTCKDKIIKSYRYKSDSNEWISIGVDELDSLNHGSGAVIKVSEDCTLGRQDAEIPQLPSLPN